MKLIIDIPKGTYEAVRVGTINQVLEYKVWNAIKNGKPLSEVLDEISGEIEGLTHLEMCGVVTPLVNGDRVLEIIEKHRRE